MSIKKGLTPDQRLAMAIKELMNAGLLYGDRDILDAVNDLIGIKKASEQATAAAQKYMRDDENQKHAGVFDTFLKSKRNPYRQSDEFIWAEEARNVWTGSGGDTIILPPGGYTVGTDTITVTGGPATMAVPRAMGTPDTNNGGI